MISLLLSDVIGDTPIFIASGPTVIDSRPEQHPMEILRELNILQKVPKNVLDYLSNYKNGSISGKIALHF